jgi:Tfp pilus assembly protein PilN
MKFGDKTAVGIDISQDQISIVLLKQGKDGPELVKSAVAPMPQGAVKDGNIEDAVLLSKAIRELKFRNRIWTKRAAVALFARPTVVQIIDMPQQAPSNIRQFVNNEIRNYVALPSRDITFDYCGINSAKRATDKKILSAAVESAKMIELIRACAKGGFRVEMIEPALIAYLRAVRTQKLMGKTGTNVLVAMLQAKVLTLCVLRNGSVEFIRTIEMAGSEAGGDDLGCHLTDELAKVVRFYDVDVPGDTGKWEITVFVDAAQSLQSVEEHIKSVIQTAGLQVRTMDDAYMDTPVAGFKPQDNEKPSPVAVGLAMNLLAIQGNDVKINLLPVEIKRAREAQKDVLIAVNAVAAILLIVIVAVGGLTAMFGRSHRIAAAKQSLIARQNTDGKLELHQYIDARLQALSSRLDRIEQISVSHHDVNWAQLFDEIRKAAPASVRISALSSQDGARMLLSGLAKSNDAINLFIKLLEKSSCIESVTLLETREQEGQNGLIGYQISCKLAVRRDKVDDAG